MNTTWRPTEIVRFFQFLDECDSFIIDESKNQDVTLYNYKNINPTNSCMHYIFINDNHRIVLQIHKNGSRKGEVDVVQGKPSVDQFFIELLSLINSDPRFNDYYLNKLFILYNIWDKKVKYYELLDLDSFNFEIGNLIAFWDDVEWGIYTNNFEVSTSSTASLDDVKSFLYIVNCFNEVCKD